METGKARLHPILLTTITTVVGLSSIVSDPMREPLAITIMFGLFSGSVMTLFVIPALFYDRRKLIHLIKRILLNQILINAGFFLIFIGIGGLLYFFGVSLDGVFKVVFLPLFIVYHLLYAAYTIYAQHTFGQTISWKVLGLKITDKENKLLPVQKLIQRFLIKKMFVL
jgi:hypothetical protein